MILGYPCEMQSAAARAEPAPAQSESWLSLITAFLPARVSSVTEETQHRDIHDRGVRVWRSVTREHHRGPEWQHSDLPRYGVIMMRSAELRHSGHNQLSMFQPQSLLLQHYQLTSKVDRRLSETWAKVTENCQSPSLSIIIAYLLYL